MLTLTGDEPFLTHIRRKAAEIGLHFNEFGLWRFHAEDSDRARSTPAPSGARIKITPGHWELLPSESEEQIFEELGLDWIDPEKRNFAFLRDGKLPRYKRKL